MSNQDDASDKSFEATPQKLLEARKKGEIARSNELLTAASYIGLLLALSVASTAGIERFGTSMSVVIGQSDELAPLFFSGAAGPLTLGMMQAVAWSFAPVFALPAMLVLAALFASRGIVFASEKIKPKLSKISIISNAKNKYGRNGLFQFLLSFLKLGIYSACLALFLQVRLDDMVSAIRTNPQTIVVLLGRICFDFLVVVVIVAVVIGGLDALWQHFEHLRKNRMSRKEVMDETKNAEGDPYMKQERRQRAQSLAGNQMASEVAKADVIIVNPTHYAIALRWDRLPGQAPICVAKGVDEMAARIREVALENNVPIHSDPPTARALHATTRLGEQVSPEHYKAVAAAIRFAEAIRRKARERAN